jgi:hypothetical protein
MTSSGRARSKRFWPPLRDSSMNDEERSDLSGTTTQGQTLVGLLCPDKEGSEYLRGCRMKCLRNVAVALCAKRVLSSHDQGCHVPERAEGANAQEELSSLGAHELVLRNKQVDKRLGCVILTQAEEPVGADALHLRELGEPSWEPFGPMDQEMLAGDARICSPS